MAVHQVAGLASLGRPGPGQPAWAALMAKNRRKTLIVCAAAMTTSTRISDAIHEDPWEAIIYAQADGTMNSQEAAQQLQQLYDAEEQRAQVERMAENTREYAREDRDAQWEREERLWERQRLERWDKEDREDRRDRMKANLELLKIYAERGYLDTANTDIENIIRRIQGDVAGAPRVSGRSQRPGRADGLDADINVSAEMPSHVQVGKVASVACRLSRAEIDKAVGMAVDTGQISADTTRLITIEVLPKTNAEVVGETRADVPVLRGKQITEAYFNIRPTHPGACQVWVVVRQDPLPLLTLRLEVAAAAARPAGPGVRLPAKAGVTIGSPTGMEDVNWLSVVEIDRGPDTGHWFYELRSTTLGILASFESRPLRNRAEYVASLYREIESRWLTSADDVEAFQEELREFGASLFSELFPELLQAALWQQKDKLRHLMVLSSEPFIPWELVHLKEPGRPLPDETRFMAEIGLVRWLYTHDSAYPPQILHARPGRVRILRPDYPRQDLRLPQTLPEARLSPRPDGVPSPLPRRRRISGSC